MADGNFHVDALKARWAECEQRYGAGYTARHGKLYEAELRSAYGKDATRDGNEHAAALLKAAGGNKEAALKAAFAEIDATFKPAPEAQLEAA